VPKFRHIQNSFRSGEVSPSVQGRTDSDVYTSGLDVCTNFVTKVQGGVARRPGSQLVASQLNSTNLTGDVKLIPFRVDSTVSYVLAFTYTGAAEASYSHYVPTGASAALGSFGITSADELDTLQYATSGNTLIVVSAAGTDIKQYKGFAANTTTAAWLSIFSTKNLGEGRSMPYFPINATPTTMTYSSGSATTGVGTLTASSAAFTSTDVGRLIKIFDGTSSTWYAQITGYTSTTIATITLINDEQTTAFVLSAGTYPTSLAATTVWELSQWGGGEGYPTSVTFFQQRLYFAKGEKVWASQSGDIYEFDAVGAAHDTGYLTVTADDPFEFTPASTEINSIQWLSGGKTLVIGTSGGEYIADGTADASLSALAITIDAATAHGSRGVQPVRLDNRLLFISSSNRVREFTFDNNEKSYKADDLSRLSSHFFRKGLLNRTTTALPKVNEIIKQESESTVAWMVDSTGMLFGTTRDSFVESNAWHFHEFGGNLAGEIPFVHSAVSMISADGLREELYVAVERTIDSVALIYLEKIGPQYALENVTNSSSLIDDKMVYSDSAKLKYNATAFTTVDGLLHLEGEVVACVADGDYKGTFTVDSSGEIELPEEVNDAVVGLPYTSTLQTLPHNVGSAVGTSQIAIKRFDRIGIRFTRTINALFGSTDSAQLDRIEFRDVDAIASLAIPLFSGDKIEDLTDNYDRRGQVIIKQDLPLPMEIDFIVLRGVLYD